MIPETFEYTAPQTLEEALELLAGGERKVLAGGQSLIPLMKLRLATPEKVVDLGRVPGLGEIQESSGGLLIGTMATHYGIAISPLVRGRCPLLAEAASHIGDVQVRNLGTIGGSIAHADPAADYPAALVALEARVHLVSAGGERTVAAGDFFLDAFTTALDCAELVTELVVPLPAERSGGAYIALKRCAPVYASASVAVQLTLNDDDTCSDARIVLGVLGLTAARVPAAEDELRNRPLSPERMDKVRQAMMEIAEPTSDMRGSAEYKRQVAGVLAKQAVEAAWKRACGKHVEVTHLYA